MFKFTIERTFVIARDQMLFPETVTLKSVGINKSPKAAKRLAEDASRRDLKALTKKSYTTPYEKKDERRDNGWTRSGREALEILNAARRRYR